MPVPMQASSALDRHQVRRFGTFEFDAGSRELRRNGALVRLPDQAARVLSALLARPGDVVTRDELIALLWPDGTHVDFDTGLNAAIKKLRKALDEPGDSPRYVETLPRRGYRFIAPVTAPRATHAPTVKNPPKPSDPSAGGAPRGRRVTTLIIAVAVIAIVVLVLTMWGRVPGRNRSAAEGWGRPSSNTDANSYFAKAQLLAGVGVHDVVRARALMEHALKLDPHFGKARVEYGFNTFIMVLAGYANVASLIYDAEREVQRGLADDPTFSHGRAALAALLLFHGKKEESRHQAEIALKMNPRDVDARHWLAVNWWMSGQNQRAGALERENLAREPRFFPAHETLGELAREEGDWATSIREHSQVLEYDPQNIFILHALARTYMDAGDLQMARATLQRLRGDDRPSLRTRALESLLLALEEEKVRASQTLDEDVRKYLELNTFDTLIAAEVNASLGEISTALEWLEKAARNGDERAEWFARDPALAALRSAPTFQALVRSIGGRRVR
jgi:DNA-binding winged helix-turn-helix (wHTH) protein/Tfp pilus assembly protein PilF